MDIGEWIPARVRVTRREWDTYVACDCHEPHHRAVGVLDVDAPEPGAAWDATFYICGTTADAIEEDG